ncbi:DNA adenine methylase [Ornithinibacillus sp. 179-J 7C1 HS]|uniref:DNA adenine methylase n=1 Tax=Ornithinibacillus sp. 179-J 7C1 HS TaxID=3142384 RepID=UPI0039A093C9
MIQPFLKWAGGKRRLIPKIEEFVPNLEKIRYFEPFLGAGALFFHFQPNRATVNDINGELINVYRFLQDNEKIDDLLDLLTKHKEKHSADHYKKVRDLDRKEEFETLLPVEKAARFIYLNKTCFNGIYRVNSKGQFNVPMGKYKDPDIVNKDVLLSVHRYLKENKNTIEFKNGNFVEAVNESKKGDFIYFDPPYNPINKTSSFTGYAQDGFGEEKQRELGELFKDLDDRGRKVLLSNSNTELIRELYRDFEIVEIPVSRAISSKATGRWKTNEILVIGKHIFK